MEIPQFLHIGERDEITDVLSLVEKAQDQCVYLICPHKSLLLMCIVNVKLLKRWCEKYKKTLAVVTQDRVTRNILAQAGIATFKDKNEVALVRVQEKEQEEVETQQVEVKNPSALFRFLQKYFPFLLRDKKEKIQLVFIKPSHRAFVALLMLGIGVFIVVLFFALPDATITISPVKNTLPIQTNVTLTKGPTSLEEKMVHMEPLEVRYDLVINEPVTGQSEKGTRAHGKVKLLNASTKPWPLLGNSRLQTKDGLVFLITKFVTVPAKNEKGPGELLADVEARDVDANSQPIGKRGNIGPSVFFIPGLSAQNQKLITAISEEAFSGGESQVEVFVTKEDQKCDQTSICKDEEI